MPNVSPRMTHRHESAVITDGRVEKNSRLMEARPRAQLDESGATPAPEPSGTTRTLADEIRAAISMGDVHAVRSLFSVSGYDVDAILDEHSGETALFLAAEGEPEIVRMLLERGASTSLTNHVGETPLTRATNYECVASCRLLVAASGGAVDDVREPECPSQPLVLFGERFSRRRGALPNVLDPCLR